MFELLFSFFFAGLLCEYASLFAEGWLLFFPKAITSLTLTNRISDITGDGGDNIFGYSFGLIGDIIDLNAYPFWWNGEFLCELLNRSSSCSTSLFSFSKISRSFCRSARCYSSSSRFIEGNSRSLSLMKFVVSSSLLS